ncbi:MAG: SPW repeat protein [Bacteroidota bacterium]|nr:SPW repeat protein [Kiloniellaceae bacterium]
MDASIRKGWFTEHRGWEDMFSAACGVLIVLSPALDPAQASAALVISVGLAGVFITMLAMLELMDHQRWEELAELACGLWVVVSPLVFGYGGALRLSHYLLGGAVAVLALLELWQDSRRQVAA